MQCGFSELVQRTLKFCGIHHTSTLDKELNIVVYRTPLYVNMYKIHKLVTYKYDG